MLVQPPTTPPPRLPSLSWSRSARTSVTSGPARGWTKSLCYGRRTQNASANWFQASMTPLRTCCVLSRWVCSKVEPGQGQPQRNPSAYCPPVPTAGPGGVALHSLRCGQHLGGLRLPQWVATEHPGAGSARACLAAPSLCGWRRFQVRSDQGQVSACRLPYRLWPKGAWAWGRYVAQGRVGG